MEGKVLSIAEFIEKRRFKDKRWNRFGSLVKSFSDEIREMCQDAREEIRDFDTDSLSQMLKHIAYEHTKQALALGTDYTVVFLITDLNLRDVQIQCIRCELWLVKREKKNKDDEVEEILILPIVYL